MLPLCVMHLDLSGMEGLCSCREGVFGFLRRLEWPVVTRFIGQSTFWLHLKVSLPVSASFHHWNLRGVSFAYVDYLHSLQKNKKIEKYRYF